MSLHPSGFLVVLLIIQGGNRGREGIARYRIPVTPCDQRGIWHRIHRARVMAREFADQSHASAFGFLIAAYLFIEHVVRMDPK